MTDIIDYMKKLDDILKTKQNNPEAQMLGALAKVMIDHEQRLRRLEQDISSEIRTILDTMNKMNTEYRKLNQKGASMT